MAKKQTKLEQGIENLSKRKEGYYQREVEHNINDRCSIWEDSNRAKAYRKGRNDIYKFLATNTNISNG